MAISLSCGIIILCPVLGLTTWASCALRLLAWPAQCNQTGALFYGTQTILYFCFAHHPPPTVLLATYHAHFPPMPTYPFPQIPEWCLAHSRHLTSISGVMKSITSSTSAQWNLQPWRASWRSCQLWR